MQDPRQGPMCRTLARGPCAARPMPGALVKDPAVAAIAAATAKRHWESQGAQPIFDSKRIACRLLLLSANAGSAGKYALNRRGAGEALALGFMTVRTCLVRLLLSS